MEQILEQWISVCPTNELHANTGICALVAQKQVAIFYCGLTQNFYAVSNYDPFGKANVISRGLIGSVGEQVFVASPLHKQRFNLKTGECLDDSKLKLLTYPVREKNKTIQVLICVEAANAA